MYRDGSTGSARSTDFRDSPQTSATVHGSLCAALPDGGQLGGHVPGGIGSTGRDRARENMNREAMIKVPGEPSTSQQRHCWSTLSRE